MTITTRAAFAAFLFTAIVAGTLAPQMASAQSCTYEHHITGIPGTTGRGYTGQILISSKMPNATARIRAFQADNGQPIDVLNSGGNAVESVTLSPTHSVKTFNLEGARGWHTAIIEHDSYRAMRSAAVALRIRSPNLGVSVVPVQGIEDCEDLTITPPPPPNLAVQEPRAFLVTADTLAWLATVTNIGTGTADETTIRLLYYERQLASHPVRELAPGATILIHAPVATASPAEGATFPTIGSRVGICVDPVPGEINDFRNNCETVTVTDPPGDVDGV